MKSFAAAIALLFLAATAHAGSVSLKKNEHFVAIASSKSLDEAIGIARLYSDPAQVFSSQNGWYAVVLGPTMAPSLKVFKKNYQGWPEIPADAVWSKGNNYIDGAWIADPLVPPAQELTLTAPRLVEKDGFKVLATQQRRDDAQSITIKGTASDKEVFSFTTPEDFYTEFGATLRLAPLDPATPEPEAIVTQYTGGAHCCVATWIATLKDGAWALVEGIQLDGGGYWLEDVDGDDTYELLSVDNAFLYAFESYAGSFATIEINQLRGGAIAPVPKNDAWKRRIVQDLAGKEFLARLTPELWSSNGFLAPWVATMILLGEGEAAWQKMLTSYEKDNGFGPQICTTGEPIESCAVENMKPVPFPEALAQFLKDNGYTPVPGG
jgi:hypothetical protein